MKVKVKKLLRAGCGASKNVVSTCSGDGSNRKVEIEEADVSCSGQEGVDLALSLHGSIWPKSGRRGFYCGHSDLGRRCVDGQMAHRTKRSMVETNTRSAIMEAVMCETRDLRIEWPHGHFLVFEGNVRIDMRYVCPKDVKKMLLQQAKTAY